MASRYQAALRNNRVELEKALPMDGLVTYLHPVGLMKNVNISQQLDDRSRTNVEKARILLNWLDTALGVGDTTPFDKFIDAIGRYAKENSDSTVDKLLKALQKETKPDLTETKPALTETKPDLTETKSDLTETKSPVPTPLKKFDPDAAIEKVTENYKYLNMLSVDAMLDELFTERVVTFKQKGDIEAAGRQGMQWFLDKVILKDLGMKESTKYKKFLQIMENHDDSTINKLAADLGGSELIP